MNYNDPSDIQLIRQLVTNIMTADDLSIARQILEQGRSLLLIANKFDKVPKHQRQPVLRGLQVSLQSVLSQGKHVPIIPTSAVTKYNINSIREAVFLQYDRWNKRVSTGMLNNWLRQVTGHKPHPQIKGKSIKLKYITQIKTRPPTFAVFCNRDKMVTDEYQRFLINSLRDSFNLAGVPIRVMFRTSENPFVNGKITTRKQAHIQTINADTLLHSQSAKSSAQ